MLSFVVWGNWFEKRVRSAQGLRGCGSLSEKTTFSPLEPLIWSRLCFRGYLRARWPWLPSRTRKGAGSALRGRPRRPATSALRGPVRFYAPRTPSRGVGYDLPKARGEGSERSPKPLLTPEARGRGRSRSRRKGGADAPGTGPGWSGAPRRRRGRGAHWCPRLLQF